MGNSKPRSTKLTRLRFSSKEVLESRDRKLMGKVGKFSKTKTEQAVNGSKGGRRRGEKNYQEFTDWVKEKNFDVAEWKDLFGENFAIVLSFFQTKGSKKSLAPKPLGGIRKDIYQICTRSGK